MLSGRGLCDELLTRPEESYRLCCLVVCDLETSRIGAPYVYDISNLRVKLTITSVTVKLPIKVGSWLRKCNLTSEIFSTHSFHYTMYIRGYQSM